MMIPSGRSSIERGHIAVEPGSACDESRDINSRAAMRRKLWSAFIAALNDSKLSYCLLGAPGDNALVTDSDVDFAVHPRDYQYVPQLLASAAASASGRLVQAIQHEITATYFAIAIQQRESVAFLHPDCTTDYRRQGRLWMPSDELLRGCRRASGGYFRPAPDIEFKYYLTKQVLKQTLSARQWTTLVTLYQAADDPREGLSWWKLTTAKQIEQCLLHGDEEGFRRLLPDLRGELIDAPFRESLIARTSSLAVNAARLGRRMANPTGLFIQISAGKPEERAELACMLAKALAPAFRRASVVNYNKPAEVLRDLVQSTLVVSPDPTIAVPALYGGLNIPWQPRLTRSENLEVAVATVLSYLSQRTMRRLGGQSPQPQRLEFDALARTTAS